MARENPGFRVQLEIILAAYPDHDCLSLKEVCAFTGLTARQVGALYPNGWSRPRAGKTITRARLAEEMTRQ